MTVAQLVKACNRKPYELVGSGFETHNEESFIFKIYFVIIITDLALEIILVLLIVI